MTAVVERRGERTHASSSGLERVRRTGAVAALLLAPWGFVVTNALYWWSTRDGGSDQTGAEALALVASEPGLFRVLLLAGMIGCLLLVPAVVTAMGLAVRSWLVFVGGSLMIGGYLAYFGVLLTTFSTIAMAEHGGPLADFAAVIDASQQDPFTSWVFGLFVLGNLVGTLLFAIGLLRSRAIPGWAAVLILLWPPLHVTGLVVGNELFEVTGAVLQAVGFATIAVVVRRRI
ncbi:MAG: hypothetical protein ABWX96_21790 [Propionibacteriaceae bacterium]